MAHDTFESPLGKRYAGSAMKALFSDDRKFSTWRKLWVALAEAEAELGLSISKAQIEEMRAHLTDIDYEAVAAREAQVRHDVMAHIYAFGLVAPSAKPIIHLGATSCFVGDNTDIILQREALLLVRQKLVSAIRALADFAARWAATPTLAYTHYQPAQPTTVGKRASLWMQDLMMDVERLDFAVSRLRLLGCRGATGTAASFLELFDGDEEKVARLEALVCEKMGFPGAFAVSGQTYTRKVDYFTLSVLSGIAQSAQKFAGDIRLLSHMQEFDEPFEEDQVGSSAMAYKRNPMRSERIASLARYVMSQAANPAMTAGAQWFERTLDDSANRRLCIPEAFLATDGLLNLYLSVISGGRVYPQVIAKHLAEQLPFFATENILMEAVKAGGDRQAVHEAIREHSVAVQRAIKEEAAENDLLERLAADPRIPLGREGLEAVVADSRFTGLAEQQTRAYVAEVLAALSGSEGADAADAKISV